jgi:hypothetical protein
LAFGVDQFGKGTPSELAEKIRAYCKNRLTRRTATGHDPPRRIIPKISQRDLGVAACGKTSKGRSFEGYGLNGLRENSVVKLSRTSMGSQISEKH